MTYTLIDDSSARNSGGFALPTVLIASVVMLTILIAAVGASSSVRTSLNVQYYNQLAREASESGVARARECLEKNGYTPLWTSDTATQLRPGTPCTGGPECTTLPSCFVVSRGNVRTTFSVGLPDDLVVSQVIHVTAKVELLRASNGGVWQTHTNTLSARVGNDINFNTVSFGYYAYGPFSACGGGSGAFFATIAADGTVRTVGDNKFGQLGNGTTVSSLTPGLVQNMPAGFVVSSMYTGFLSQGSNLYMIGTSGDVYGFGEGCKGQLGNGLFENKSTPVPFQLSGKLGKSITVNGKNTFVLTQDGRIYSTGSCWFGSLGRGDLADNTDIGCSDQATPGPIAVTYIPADDNTHATPDIVADGYAAFARMEGGRVYGWGFNHNGQLGLDPAVTQDRSTPVQIGTYGDIAQPEATQLSFDGETLYVLDNTGKVFSYGSNQYGQMGNGVTTDGTNPISTPVLFQIPVAAGVATKVVTDQNFVSVLTASNQVYSAGLNDSGQLGNDSTAAIEATPVLFQLPGTVKAIDVYSASLGPGSTYNNTFVVGDDGNVYGAGRNDYGQLGIEVMTPFEQKPVAMHLGGVHASQIKTGFGTTVVQSVNNKLYTVGNNSNGQLGDGTTTSSSKPLLNPYVNILPANYY